MQFSLLQLSIRGYNFHLVVSIFEVLQPDLLFIYICIFSNFCKRKRGSVQVKFIWLFLGGIQNKEKHKTMKSIFK